MNFSNDTWLKAADATSQGSDLGKPWEPLADNDDDGGDRTTQVDPEI